MPPLLRRLALLVSLSCAVVACSASKDTSPRDGGGVRDAGGDPADALTPDAGDSDGAITGRDAAPSDDAAAPVCSDTTFDLPYPDALPGDMTDPASCPTCAHFDAITIVAAATTVHVTGTVVGATTTCHWHLRSPTCAGTTGAFDPGEFTSFDLTLPLFCGTNRLQLVCEGPAGRTIATRDIEGPACTTGRALQVTLSWGAVSLDQELHLVREGGRINDTVSDCTWFTCMSGALDWGVIGDRTDDPTKDVDNVGAFGPENIYLTSAPAGRYSVLVEYWGSGTPDSPEVTIAVGGRTVWRGSHLLDVHDVWYVGTVDFPAGTFTPLDTLTPCGVEWRTLGSRGCPLALP